MKFPAIIQRTCFGVLFALLGATGVFLYPFSVSDPNITAEVFYAHYGCGDFCAQYRVIKVSRLPATEAQQLIGRDSRNSDNENLNPIRFIGWDVLVLHKGDNEALSRYLDTHLDKTGACKAPIFKLTGQFKRRLVYSLLYSEDKYDGTYFDAQSAVAVGDPSPTCKQAKEAPL